MKKMCVNKFEQQAMDDLNAELFEEENGQNEEKTGGNKDNFCDFEGNKINAEIVLEDQIRNEEKNKDSDRRLKNGLEFDFVAKLASKKDEQLKNKISSLKMKISKKQFDEIRFFYE